MAQGKVKELIDKYEEIRARKERLTTEKTEAMEEYKKIQVDLAAAITEIGEDNVTDGGYTYTPGTQRKYNLKSEDDCMDMGVDRIKVLKDNGFDEIVKETVNAKTLNSAMKETAETDEGIPDEVLAILNTYDEITVSRKKNKSDKQDRIKEALERRKENV